MNVEQKIVEWTEALLASSDCFIVSHSVKPTNNFKLYIDCDEGFSLKKAIEINRQLRREIEEAGLFPDGDFSLEVSSPGIDEPLKLLRQYKKNIGRLILVETNDGETVEGRLLAVSEAEVTIEIKGIKKIPTTQVAIQFNKMKQATIQIEFKK